MNQIVDGQKLLSEAKFYEGYSRFIEAEKRYETWEEAVERVMNMHRQKYADKMTPELEEAIAFAEQAYKEMLVLGSQRALQFGGEQIFKHETKLYNCSFGHASRTRFFQEAMYLLLSGCGVGFSVQSHHIAKLPEVVSPGKEAIIHVVEDSIEGWADAFGVLYSSYLTSDQPYPEYAGKVVHFDYSQIRLRGSFISGGFKAPGPDGLEAAIEKCRKILQTATAEGPRKLRAIEVYDFTMHMSDAVLSGGVRRSATICIFSRDDQEMLTAKTGNWFVDNPQRGRSNNSVALLKKDVPREMWDDIMSNVRHSGEPGFVFLDDLEHGYNPCVEIGMLPVLLETTGESGFQFCNLCETNGGMIASRELLMRAAKAAAILGTLQAGYTNFRYLTDVTRLITEREALIGVSITGWMNNPDVLFDENNLVDAAALVKATNREIASLIDINPAARTTCTKPSGNASVRLGCASGIHGEHAPRYFRNVQMNTDSEVAQAIMKTNPKMVEKSVWNPNGTDIVVSFPIEAKEGSIYKKELEGVRQLEFVKKAQKFWVESGKDESLCVDPTISHNISNTITVDDWDEVSDYIYENREHFSGISLMSAAGDRAYPQSPFTEVYTDHQLLDMYGTASLFASGLVVDGMHAFNNNLWSACSTAIGEGEDISEENSDNAMKRDWVRRAKKFARNYFLSSFEGNVEVLSEEAAMKGAMQKMTECLKDVHNLHKWESIVRTIKPIDFANELDEVRYVEADTLGAQSCQGNACEINL